MDNKETIRVVVFGKSDTFKDSMFNALIGEEKLFSKISSDTGSSKYEAISFKHKNRSYLLVDTPSIIMRYIFSNKMFFYLQSFYKNKVCLMSA